ncbi:hypothetical protein O0I10_012087 [Lichtheimia ornata]|uniref:Uncharacterized protein n=1 Tax=Lichtheimia ornata TaxID=688661 RepID=A0AAD7UT72_9FUNG|nr:uncharacterized protein O0I10_012087 [Lichtheimia ornata]KAJ8652274.1 hypothetical protein O0I10_012087 [Lichtheimia ornata]
MQQLECDNLLSTLTAAMHLQRHDQVIDTSQLAVGDLKHQLVQLLYARSDSLIALNQLETALEKALLDPASPMGPLRKGLNHGCIEESKDTIHA